MAALVLDKRKKPLMPCSEKRAWLLLERGRAFRRRRRSRLRHRAPRFDNRTRPRGWLAPSLQHRVDTTLARVNRLCRLVPITAIDMELVRFDMQAMENPEISATAVCCNGRTAMAIPFNPNRYRRPRAGPCDRAAHDALSLPDLKVGVSRAKR